jgi:hypothetical protein
MNTENYNEDNFNLENFINNFVFSNWKNLQETYHIEDIEIEIKNDDEIEDEELFYKDIVYNEY